MESFNRVDLMQHTDFKDVLSFLKPGLKREKLEEIITAAEFVYYGKRKEHQQEFFLPGETKFFPLDKLDEKYDEYKRLAKKLAADEEESDPVGFRVDYGILAVLNKSKSAIKQLKTQDPGKFEKNLYEFGLVTIELALDTERFEQEKLKKVLDYYGDILNNTEYFTKLSVPTANKSIIKYQEPPLHGPKSMPGKPPFFIYARSLLSEPIPAEEPTTMPEQEYLDQLMRQPDNGQKGKYTEAEAKAINIFRETWQGTWGDYETDQPKAIIPDEPDDVIGYLPNIKINDKKPVVPITNQSDLLKALGLYPIEGLGEPRSDLLKALGVNPLESLGELEKKVSGNPVEKKDAPIEGAKPLAKPKEYDECKREPVPGSSIYLCKMPDRYQCCEYKGEAFKNPKWASTPRCNLENYEAVAKAKK